MESITHEEQLEFQEFFSYLFGDQARRWNINMPMLKLLEELLSKNKSCSKYMDMVPRPFYIGNAIRWTSRQARQAVIRHLKRKHKSYFLCLKSSAFGMRTKFQAASMGI
jgi:hypothetical protein